jgi:hypothetical protein
MAAPGRGVPRGARRCCPSLPLRALVAGRGGLRGGGKGAIRRVSVSRRRAALACAASGGFAPAAGHRCTVIFGVRRRRPQGPDATMADREVGRHTGGTPVPEDGRDRARPLHRRDAGGAAAPRSGFVRSGRAGGRRARRAKMIFALLRPAGVLEVPRASWHVLGVPGTSWHLLGTYVARTWA